MDPADLIDPTDVGSERAVVPLLRSGRGRAD
jgi:hypothetical protein